MGGPGPNPWTKLHGQMWDAFSHKENRHRRPGWPVQLNIILQVTQDSVKGLNDFKSTWARLTRGIVNQMTVEQVNSRGLFMSWAWRAGVSPYTHPVGPNLALHPSSPRGRQGFTAEVKASSLTVRPQGTFKAHPHSSCFCSGLTSRGHAL